MAHINLEPSGAWYVDQLSPIAGPCVRIRSQNPTLRAMSFHTSSGAPKNTWAAPESEV